VRRETTEPLTSGTRNATKGVQRKNLLVVCEFALATVSLTSSALLMPNFFAVLRIDPGFRPEHVLTARVELPPGLNRIQTTQFHDAMERIRNAPGDNVDVPCDPNVLRSSTAT
jgi:putative ABC transport system permease protein